MPAKEKLNILKSFLCDLSNTQRLINKSNKIKLCINEIDSETKDDDDEIKKVANLTKDVIEQLTQEITEIKTGFNKFYENEFCDKNQEICDTIKNKEKNIVNGILKPTSEHNNANDSNENNENNDENLDDNEKKNFIRCVDIKKLMDKNTSTPNKNTSVIVLSDSDSSPIKQLNHLSDSISVIKINKTNKLKPAKEKTPTKSVLKKSDSSSKKKKNVSFRDPETSEIDDLEEIPQSTRLHRKTKPLDLHDLSSLSSDDSSSSECTSSEEIAQTTKRKVLTKRNRRVRSDSPIPSKLNKELKLDAKMSGKCFVPLTRLHPEVLKKNYEKLLLKNEVRRLTNMHSLKRNRKERRNSSSSESSSSSASNNQKKRSKTTKKRTNVKSSSSDTDVSNTENNDSLSSPKNDVNDLGNEIIDKNNIGDVVDCENEEAMAQDLLYGIGNEEEVIGDGEIGGEEVIGMGEEENGVQMGGNVELEENVEREEEVRVEAEVGLQEEVIGMEEEDEVVTDQTIEKKTEEASDTIEDSIVDGEDGGKKKNNEKSKWRNDKLLTSKLSGSSDSEDEKKKKKKCHKKKSKSHKIHKPEESNDVEINQDKVQEEEEKQEEVNDKSSKDDSESDSDVISKNKTDKKDDSGSDLDVSASKKIKKKKEEESDESFAKFWEKKEKLIEKSEADEVPQPKKTTKRITKKIRRILTNEESDSDSSEKKDSSDSDSSKSSAKDSDLEKNDVSEKTTKKRRRIKKIVSSDEDGEDKSTRKQIRKVLNRDSLSETTIAAEREEAERKARILEKQKKYNQIFEPDSLEKSTVDKVVLDFEDEKETLVVHKDITKHLKPHQAKGIQFMWNTCFESVERAQKESGSGCILAHCMGLGKTLQVISLVHTLLTNQEKTKIQKVLIVCPLSTVLNWVAEFKKWLPDEDEEINVFDIVQYKQNVERSYQIKEWDRCGGALVLGYDMFRNLTNATGKRMTKKLKQGFHKYLVDPGPDLVICDEGHLLKNEKTSLSIAMNKLKTARRIVLTGTPLQNNLKEYWCMVQFVKPNLLGTYKEYLNRFVNPIVNGQYTDSTEHDIQLMRKRSHVLHKLLDGVVQRRDYAVLAPFLPPKHEYVLFVALTKKQIQLYNHYMKEKARRPSEGTGRSSFLFVDFQELQRICTHPRVLLDKSIENKIARDKKEWENDESEGSIKDFIDDGSDKTDTSNSSSSSGSDSDSSNDSTKKKKPVVGRRRVTRATAGQVSESEDEQPQEELDPLEWWREFVTNDDLDDILISGKLGLLFEILNHCENIGDKVLIFSQSLYSLNVIEYFLAKVDDATQNSASGSYCGFSGSWSLGLDYFRLDGSSSADNRAAWCNTFNNPDNVRARLFLISTRAGGLGINLVAANRVIIFDVSWNPSHDTQSIYRVYRFGQNKPSYIYRFVTLGTMEMKIYERQVIKQAISKRVIDEQQIDRHYNQNDIAELYKFDPDPEGERPIPLVPVDVLLGELLQQDHKIYKYHEHQSLLENKEDEVLDEAERKAAWEEFENEKKARQYSGSINHIPIASIVRALTSILQRESPTITPQLINELVPNMLQELQEKLAQGDNSLYNQVLNEIRLMQATAQQQRIEEYYRLQQQQQQNMLLQQYQQQLLANPVAAAQFMSQFGQMGQQALSAMAGFSRGGARMPQPGVRMPGNVGRGQQNNQNNQQPRSNQASSTEIIELND